ncbi:MAG: AbrB/MazE/SpoVT family DNA-binding domain-containing protein [Candidatus Asgardarchaeia archaeon]
MPITKITRNNQITLPAEIRKALNVKEGDYLEIVIENGKAIIRKLERERKRIKLGKKLTSEEINEIIVKGMKECMR